MEIKEISIDGRKFDVGETAGNWNEVFTPYASEKVKRKQRIEGMLRELPVSKSAGALRENLNNRLETLYRGGYLLQKYEVGMIKQTDFGFVIYDFLDENGLRVTDIS